MAFVKVLVINGPNLNLLGMREPGIYGSETYEKLCDLVQTSAHELGIEVECMQSNHEGVLVDAIQQAYGVYDGIIINPAAYTHTSIALL
ncbi:MAG: 3-dehydroquinate dehydratase, partial [Eggerthellaceae bacterium]|nr:3-dehydroquinate dehydratase [Eggerthellaceae bacterium]